MRNRTPRSDTSTAERRLDLYRYLAIAVAVALLVLGFTTGRSGPLLLAVLVLVLAGNGAIRARR